MTKISSEYQEILKLKDILENNLSTSEDYLKKCLESTIPNCRRLAFLIIKNKQEYAKLLIKDPYHKIRALAICYCTNIDILLELLSDQNDCIRVEVLKRLNELENVDFNELLLTKLSYLINDVSLKVRIEFTRLLKKFNNLSEDFFKKFFDKNDIGLFVYGCEDEYEEVRENILRSIGYFNTSESMAVLIDMLNEDSENVRELVSSILKYYTANYDKSCTKEELKFLLASLDESNLFIRNNIIEVLSKLRYQDFKIFFKIQERLNIDETYKLECLISIVKNNKELFQKFINENVEYQLDAKKSLYDESYIGVLIILHVLEPKNLSLSIKEDLKFITFKIELDSAISDKIPRHLNSEYMFLIKNNVILEDLKLNPNIMNYEIIKCKEIVESIRLLENDDDQEEFIRFLISFFNDSEHVKMKTGFYPKVMEILDLLYNNFDQMTNRVKLKDFCIIASDNLKKYNNNTVNLELNCLFHQNDLFDIKLGIKDMNGVIYIDASPFISFPIKIYQSDIRIFLCAFYKRNLSVNFKLTNDTLIKID